MPRRFVEYQVALAAAEGFTVSGKIDRIDQDPMSASGIVQDYKSGAGAHSARQIAEDERLQVPLYILVLRDLVGIEPLGGLYRALAGARGARGLVLDGGGARGVRKQDHARRGQFWAHVDRAVERAQAAVARIRAGDVEHDPRGGTCPTWCDRWPMCRVKRA